MPKPPLPPHLVKNVQLKVFFRDSEMKHLKKMAVKHKCKTLSEYVRKALIHYENSNNDLPDVI